MIELRDDQETHSMLKSRYTSVFYNTALVKNIFCLYCVCLIFLVFFTPNRVHGYYHHHEIHFVPLESTLGGLQGPGDQPFWRYWIGYTTNLLGNIALFMPMGFLLKAFSRKSSTGSIVLIGALISANIELLQLTFRIGVCDVDDVILNTLGTWLGVCLFGYMRFKVQGIRCKVER
jgi:glycopeptide antibiotics resistance protein